MRRAAAAASRRCRPDAERRRRDGDSGSRAGGELLKLLLAPIIKRVSKPESCSASSCDAVDSVRCMAGRLVVVVAAAVVMAIGRVVYLRFLAQC